jgi:hypothetical protein
MARVMDQSDFGYQRRASSSGSVSLAARGGRDVLVESHPRRSREPFRAVRGGRIAAISSMLSPHSTRTPSVRTGPGARLLTRIPCSPNAADQLRVNDARASSTSCMPKRRAYPRRGRRHRHEPALHRHRYEGAAGAERGHRLAAHQGAADRRLNRSHDTAVHTGLTFSGSMEGTDRCVSRTAVTARPRTSGTRAGTPRATWGQSTGAGVASTGGGRGAGPRGVAPPAEALARQAVVSRRPWRASSTSGGCRSDLLNQRSIELRFKAWQGAPHVAGLHCHQPHGCPGRRCIGLLGR